jgi:hypothetical protein
MLTKVRHWFQCSIAPTLRNRIGKETIEGKSTAVAMMIILYASRIQKKYIQSLDKLEVFNDVERKQRLITSWFCLTEIETTGTALKWSSAEFEEGDAFPT